MTLPARGGSETRAVLGRGSVYTVATAGPALAAVAVIPLVTRVLPRSEYDTVAVLTLLIQVGYIVVALGMGAAVTRQYILHRDGADGARGLVLQGAVLSLGLAGLLAATASWWSPAALGRAVGSEVLLALAATLGGAWLVIAQAWLRGADRAAAFVGLSIGASLLGPAAGLLAVSVSSPTASVYLLGVCAGYLLSGVAGVLIVVGSGSVRPRADNFVEGLRIGLPTVPHQVSLYLAVAGLVIVADRLLADSGRASIGLTIGGGATVLTAGLNNAWAPLVYRTPAGERGAVLTQTASAIAAVTVATAGGIALLGPWLLQIAAPASFGVAELVPVVAVSSAAALPSVMYLASGHLIIAKGRTGWLSVTTPLAVAAGLAFAVLLTPRAGLLAVAGGYLVTYLLLTAATTALQRAVADPPWWPPLLPVTVVGWLVATLCGALLGSTGGGAVTRVVLAVVLSVGALWRVRHTTGRGSAGGATRPSGLGR